MRRLVSYRMAKTFTPCATLAPAPEEKEFAKALENCGLAGEA